MRALAAISLLALGAAVALGADKRRRRHERIAEGDARFRELMTMVTEQVAATRNAPGTSRIPRRYVPATWRDMTPIDWQTFSIGIGFQTDDGDVFLRLCASDLSHIADQFEVFYRGDLDRTNSQSESDAAGEKSEVLSPEGTLKCEP